MILLRTVEQVRTWVAERHRCGARLALVPTMGALHRGHLALVEGARQQGHGVVLSVFVNPTQFAPGEDFGRYPRDLERDAAMAAAAGVDVLFAPEPGEMYPGAEPSVTVEVGSLGAVLEGQYRPTFFRGVATVVSKLLIALRPDVAVFGQKDAQQVVVVRRLVAELLLPVEILCVPTVRDPDGLALSSRNIYLSPRERAAAPVLQRALGGAVEAVRAGQRGTAAVEAALREVLDAEPLAQTEYAMVVSAGDLRPVERLEGRILLLLAVRIGGTRLLDNACLDVAVERVTLALP